MKKDFIDVSPDTGSNNGKLSVVASKNPSKIAPPIPAAVPMDDNASLL